MEEVYPSFYDWGMTTMPEAMWGPGVWEAQGIYSRLFPASPQAQFFTAQAEGQAAWDRTYVMVKQRGPVLGSILKDARHKDGRRVVCRMKVVKRTAGSTRPRREKH